ncbi:MAG: hypothetical protein KatS3mg008_0082 [Acidimicrobiales bacterium]|nr:MAG: hypothetical protein KatS3mg008_0082 [Acidimicrobiales bacterium]
MRNGLRLTDVTFTERRRGYDPDEVSNFLARVNDAIVELQRRLEAAEARAMSAEERAEAAARHAAELQELGGPAQAPTGSSETEEALKRVLLLAQKTADEAIADANRRREEIVREAEKKAERILGDAERRAKALVEDAERRARERAALQSRPIEVEMRRLEQRKTELLKEVAALEEQLRRQLDSAKAAATRLLEAVEASGRETLTESESERLQTSPDTATSSSDTNASETTSAEVSDVKSAEATSSGAVTTGVSETTSVAGESARSTEAQAMHPEEPPLLRELREVVADPAGGDPDARLEDFLESREEDEPRGLLLRRRRERNGGSSQ